MVSEGLIADDLLQPFYLEACGVRGRAVRLGPALSAILDRHQYPPAVNRLLGESIVLAVLLAGSLKYDGVFTLQTKGDGPVRMLVADVTSGGDIRAYAQFDADQFAAGQLDGDQLHAAGSMEAPVPRLLGNGYVAFTVDQGEDMDRYQGIVELTGATLTDCLHHYFAQSEQLKTALKVACRPVLTDAGASGPMQWRAGGIMVQQVPDEGGLPGAAANSNIGTGDADEAEDNWRRPVLLMASASDAELTDSHRPVENLLFRLFHQEQVRVFAQRPLMDRCRCSRERVSNVLRTIPVGEFDDLKVDGKVEVTCEFCSTRYLFDDAEIAALASSA